MTWGAEHLSISYGDTAALVDVSVDCTPGEILARATSSNGELLALTGVRNPYPDGPLGVIREGAYADILLVDGNPLEGTEVLLDAEENIDLIMKGGVIYKNALGS